MVKIINDVQYLIVARQTAEFNFLVNKFHEKGIFDDKETRKKMLKEKREQLILILRHKVPDINPESLLSNPEDNDITKRGIVDVDLIIEILKKQGVEKNDISGAYRKENA